MEMGIAQRLEVLLEAASSEELREHHLLHQRWATPRVTVGRG